MLSPGAHTHAPETQLLPLVHAGSQATGPLPAVATLVAPAADPLLELCPLEQLAITIVLAMNEKPTALLRMRFSFVWRVTQRNINLTRKFTDKSNL